MSSRSKILYAFGHKIVNQEFTLGKSLSNNIEISRKYVRFI